MSVESISLVLNHSRASGTDKLVLIGIANHDGDGGSWPSIATLARYANVQERTVQRSIAHLVALGEVVVHDQQGGTRQTRPDRRPNRYEITLQRRGDADVTPSGVNGVTPVTERGDAHVTRTVLEPSTTTTSPSTGVEVPAAQDSVEFEQFWHTYPRRAGKRAAQLAYTRLRRQGIMHTDILDGAQRYRDDPNREDQFTKHPTTWLNSHGWLDDPLPIRARARTSANDAVAQTLALANRLGVMTTSEAGPWGQIGAGS